MKKLLQRERNNADPLPRLRRRLAKRRSAWRQRLQLLQFRLVVRRWLFWEWVMRHYPRFYKWVDEHLPFDTLPF